jgi:uroporphyrin-3 C-methyltransferase
MNEHLPAPMSETSAEAITHRHGLSWLALLLALVSLGGMGWLWWQGSAGEKAAEGLNAETARQAAAVSALESRLAGLESRVSGMAAADTSARLGSIEQELKSLQGEASAAKSFQTDTGAWSRSMQAAIEGDQARLAGAEARLAALSAREMSATAELDLAEIDYVLRLAQERLVLFGDIRTAIQALRIAEQQVTAFDNPLYLGLRGEISSALQSLSLVNAADYPAIYTKLDGLQGFVASMPLKGAPAAEAAAPEVQEGWWARLRNTLSSLVTVRRTTTAEEDLPLLAEQEFIRQQAWLELEVARLAAMRREQLAYQAALGRFVTTLERWFDPAGQGRREAGVLLDALRPLNVDPELPDISAPWTALQAIRATGIATDPKSEAQADQPGEQATVQ